MLLGICSPRKCFNFNLSEVPSGGFWGPRRLVAETLLHIYDIMIFICTLLSITVVAFITALYSIIIIGFLYRYYSGYFKWKDSNSSSPYFWRSPHGGYERYRRENTFKKPISGPIWQRGR